MVWRYFWMLLLLGIIYFLYSCGIVKEIGTHLADGTLNVIDTIYFELNENSGGQKVFTASELERYTNVENGLYLSILGQVFDVTKGEKHYGSRGSYHAFIGNQIFLTSKDVMYVHHLPNEIIFLQVVMPL